MGFVGFWTPELVVLLKGVEKLQAHGPYLFMTGLLAGCLALREQVPVLGKCLGTASGG